MILNALACPEAELSLVLVDDSSISHMNATYLQRPWPTNVISFSQQEGEGSSCQELLGDVVISVETAARQAQEVGGSLYAELCFLLIHGTLHLLGYDHEEGCTAAQAQAMAAREQELFQQVAAQVLPQEEGL